MASEGKFSGSFPLLVSGLEVLIGSDNSTSSFVESDDPVAETIMNIAGIINTINMTVSTAANIYRPFSSIHSAVVTVAVESSA